jgi:hypothetical protein
MKKITRREYIYIIVLACTEEYILPCDKHMYATSQIASKYLMPWHHVPKESSFEILKI